MLSDRKIVILILVVIDFTIASAQHDYNYRSDSESFEDLSSSEEDSYGTKDSHASSMVSLFYYEKKPGDEGPPLVRPNDRGECPPCYVITLINDKCVQICKLKDIDKYLYKQRQFHRNYYKEEQEEIKKRSDARKKELARRKKEPRYISAQRDIVDWFKNLFKRNDNVKKSETEKKIIQWFKDLFKITPSKRKDTIFDYDVDYH